MREISPLKATLEKPIKIVICGNSIIGIIREPCKLQCGDECALLDTMKSDELVIRRGGVAFGRHYANRKTGEYLSGVDDDDTVVYLHSKIDDQKRRMKCCR